MSRSSPWPLLALVVLTALLMLASGIWQDGRLIGVTSLCVSLLCGVFCRGMLQTGVAETKQGRFTREGEPLRYWYTVWFLGAFSLLFGIAGLGILAGLLSPCQLP
jgi:hypothetical protein